MNDMQRTRQQQACHVRFKQLVSAGVIAAEITVYALASEMVGRQIASLKELADHELNALRDRLEGKESKQLAKCYELAKSAEIKDLNAWIRKLSGYPKFTAWRGHTVETLPATQQWRLSKMLERRICELRIPYGRRAS